MRARPEQAFLPIILDPLRVKKPCPGTGHRRDTCFDRRQAWTIRIVQATDPLHIKGAIAYAMQTIERKNTL